jgi:hypothetical protein
MKIKSGELSCLVHLTLTLANLVPHFSVIEDPFNGYVVLGSTFFGVRASFGYSCKAVNSFADMTDWWVGLLVGSTVKIQI